MIEYRITCAKYGKDAWHKSHVVHPALGDSVEKVKTKVDVMNADPVMQFRSHRGCKPWRAQARFISGWTDDIDTQWIEE